MSKPDHAHYANLDTWTLDELLALLLNEDPKKVNVSKLNRFAEPELFERHRKLLQIAARAGAALKFYSNKSIGPMVDPTKSLQFFANHGVEIPKDLQAALNDRKAKSPPNAEAPASVPASSQKAIVADAYTKDFGIVADPSGLKFLGAVTKWCEKLAKAHPAANSQSIQRILRQHRKSLRANTQQH